jgi:hypothetical protein
MSCTSTTSCENAARNSVVAISSAAAIPLVPIATLGPVMLAVPILLRSRRIGEVLDAMPASWIVALQVLRVNGFAFLIGWVYGTAPGVFALPAGIGDILTGLLGVPVAISLGSGGRESRRAAGVCSWQSIDAVRALSAIAGKRTTYARLEVFSV